MRQKGTDLRLAHLRRMAPAVKMDEADDPVDIGALGANAIVTHADRRAHLLEERRTGLRIRSFHRFRSLPAWPKNTPVLNHGCLPRFDAQATASAGGE